MVCDMDAMQTTTACANDEPRSTTNNSADAAAVAAAAASAVVANATLPNTPANCASSSSSARQSPKVCITPGSSSSSMTASNAILLQRNSLSPSVPRKIISKNNNNTIFPTSYPTNLAELQLYRVMQNASLLLYYDTLLEMGGDDVQQLCDAGEEEFLEIMSLVGMASKPLHVRRLQKSLQEWVTNPTKFKMPLIPGEDFELELSSPRVTSNHGFYSVDSGDSNRTMYSPSPGDICALPPVSSPGLSLNKRPYSPLDPSCPPSSSSSPGSSMNVQLTPTLMDSQITKLAAAAERLSKSLPSFEPKPHNTKKKVCKELELVMSMPENDPRRMDEIRRFIPALLTRRDELFPLARQVVKDSGCYYSKTQLTSVYMSKQMNSDSMDSRGSPRMGGQDNDGPPMKKPKMEPTSDSDDQRQDSYEDAVVMRTTLHSLFQNNSKNSSRGTRRSSLGVELDDTESHFSYSNSSSPKVRPATNKTTFKDCLLLQFGQEQDGSHRKMENQNESEEDLNKFSPKVIAASGDNIIAVANPALAMSPAIITPITLKESRSDKD
ncbi:NGFI-A-binding protein homolog isoform X3 [Aethina tumida]|uniref:NGFI-A-binding protein homolog isoform X3 n=1 Tax=Aethina tumida TaxID=116153 RepID=UPI0021490E1F|nr:NGFI-A-binding protein homolog isoform X3 [Aethina tumida]